MSWWHRIFRLNSEKNAKEQQEDGELPSYVELWMRELIDSGLDPQAAREEALRCFGLLKSRVTPIRRSA